MLAAMFVVGGLDQLRNPASKVEGARPLVTKLADASGQQPDVELAVRANGTAMVLGGALLGTGFAPRLGATILVGSLLPTTISATRSGRSTTRSSARSSASSSSRTPACSVGCSWPSSTPRASPA